MERFANVDEHLSDESLSLLQELLSDSYLALVPCSEVAEPAKLPEGDREQTTKKKKLTTNRVSFENTERVSYTAWAERISGDPRQWAVNLYAVYGFEKQELWLSYFARTLYMRLYNSGSWLRKNPGYEEGWQKSEIENSRKLRARRDFAEVLSLNIKDVKDIVTRLVKLSS